MSTKNPQKNLEIRFSYKMAAKTTSGFRPYSCSPPSRCLNKLQEWADASGFKFSSSKTVCMHFCRLRKHHLDPELFLYGMPIPVVQEVKFLGLIFDSKLSFLPHIRYLKNKSSKALNLIRVVAHTSWGTDQDTLLLLYTSLIRSNSIMAA